MPPDSPSFDDLESDTKFSVNQGEMVQGLTANDLKTKPLTIDLDMTKRGPLQLCLLVLNGAQKPARVLLRYEGLVQEFTLSWHEWGWAPISLLKEYEKDLRVRFEIADAEPGADLRIAKVYLRYQNIKRTD